MANEPKWTAGPWVAERCTTSEIEVGAETPRGHLSVAWVCLGDKPNASDIEDGTADARLIAAAPDLFDALMAYQRANRVHNDAEDALYGKAEAAIEKALGAAASPQDDREGGR